MCAPRSVGAIDPVGMTNASTTNARKTNARMKATRIDSIVSLMLPSWCPEWAGSAGRADLPVGLDVDDEDRGDGEVVEDGDDGAASSPIPPSAESAGAGVLSARSEGMGWYPTRNGAGRVGDQSAERGQDQRAVPP